MSDLLKYAKEVFKIEADAILDLSSKLNQEFEKCVKQILDCQSKVIVCGIGKSGIIGRKISSTLASTGTQSVFMHPGEAFHGDLGVLHQDDILILISYSGETEEILRIIPFLKENKNFIIAMTGNARSTLANQSNIHLDVSVKKEACPLDMAPTSSTTATLVMGDALAVALMKERGFKEEDFARFHPGGSIGKRLLTKVEDSMVKSNLPLITQDFPMKDVIPAMTTGRLGLVVIVDDKKKVIGIITDGDLRRALNKHDNIMSLKAKDVMTKGPRIIRKDILLYEAENLLREHKMNALIVCDDDQKCIGIQVFHNFS